MLEFQWDVHNRAHVAAHKVSVAEAEQVIYNNPLDVAMQTVSGEERFVQLGESKSGRILIVIITWRGDLIRVVTAFEAPKALKDFYLVEKGNDYGSAPEGP